MVKRYFNIRFTKTLSAGTYAQFEHKLPSKENVYIERIIYDYVPDTANEADGDYARFHVSQDSESDIKMIGNGGVGFSFSKWWFHSTNGASVHNHSKIFQFDLPVRLLSANHIYVGMKATRASTMGFEIIGYTLEGGKSGI